MSATYRRTFVIFENERKKYVLFFILLKMDIMVVVDPNSGVQYYRSFLAKYAKFRQQIWAVQQGINPRDKNQKQANFCSQVVVELITPYSIKALCI